VALWAGTEFCWQENGTEWHCVLVQSFAGSRTVQSGIVDWESFVVINAVWVTSVTLLRQRRYFHISLGSAFTLRPFSNVALLQLHVLSYANHYNCHYIILRSFTFMRHSIICSSVHCATDQSETSYCILCAMHRHCGSTNASASCDHQSDAFVPLRITF